MIKRLLLMIFIVTVMTSCFKSEDEKIKIGLVMGLSGKYSSLGTQVEMVFFWHLEKLIIRLIIKK